MNSNAKFKRSCKCGNIDFFSATNREVAFQIISEDIAKSSCSKCSSKNIYLLIPKDFKINDDVLKEWSLNEKLRFDDYGYEDYDISNAPLKTILTIIDDKSTLDPKKSILFSALCIKARDKEKNKEIEEFQKIMVELKNRKKIIERFSDSIDSKIKKKLFPALDISYKEVDVPSEARINLILEKHSIISPYPIHLSSVKKASLLKRYFLKYWNMIK